MQRASLAGALVFCDMEKKAAAYDAFIQVSKSFACKKMEIKIPDNALEE